MHHLVGHALARLIAAIPVRFLADQERGQDLEPRVRIPHLAQRVVKGLQRAGHFFAWPALHGGNDRAEPRRNQIGDAVHGPVERAFAPNRIVRFG